MPSDLTSPFSTKQLVSGIHVPWLSPARAEIDRLDAAPGQLDLSDPRRPILAAAIELADKGFVRLLIVSAAAPPVATPKGERKLRKRLFDQEKVEPLRQSFEAALRVGAAHGLEQLLTRLRNHPTEGPSVEDVQKALCLPTHTPPALVAELAPLAEFSKPEPEWVERVRGSLKYWRKELGNAFVPQPWEREAWNQAWASSAALTFLDRILHHVPRTPGLGDFDYWACVIATLKDSRWSFRQLRTRLGGTLSCLPTDATSKLRVRLQISSWLAYALDPPRKDSNSDLLADHDLRALRLNLNTLGDRSKTETFGSNGLQIGHVYLSVFIQRLGQSIEPLECALMNSQHPTPPARLPAELKNSRSGDWTAQCMGIISTQEKALAAHHAREGGRVVPVEQLMDQRRLRFNKRLLPATQAISLPPCRPLDAEVLEWQPPPEGDSKSLGSICLKGLSLGNGEPPQYADCSVIVKLKDRWHAIYPDLWEDEDEKEGGDDEERVYLHAYAPLPQALEQAGGWPRLAAAMPEACWVVHFRGLGMLLLATIDLDSETSS